MPKELFGTDGIRGVPGTPPLDDGTLYATGRSLGNYLKETSPAARVLIGMDTRESGPHIAAVLAAGLGQSGVLVDFAGIITTPGVACLVRQRGFQAGAVISASHNPFHDNGVKLFSGAGMKFPDAVEETLEEDILRHRGEPAPTDPPALIADESLDARYLDFLRSRVLPGAKLSSLRMVLDCANGAAYKLGPELFESLGAHVIAIGADPDGRNINADCGSMHLEGLQKRVVAERAGLGIAFDGGGPAFEIGWQAEGESGGGDLDVQPWAGANSGARRDRTRPRGSGRPLRAGGNAAEQQCVGWRTVRACDFPGRLAGRRRFADRGEDCLFGFD